ncbi:MAG: hypothetical protein HUU46_19635 [Candidatus Hydrogenedentes bacterium]|nr:hypothetical protein [Candidatus Hydrogenedentota bacterium]
MNLSYFRLGLGLVLAAVLASSQFAYAQAEAPATPEPGDAPVVEKVEVVPAEPPAAEPAAEPAETEAAAADTTATVPFDAKRIEQRVDGTNQQEIIRIAQKPKKNVTRIDNRPNRPKVTPIAVIKGPVSPWGYGPRYLAGEVNRPAARDIQGVGPDATGGQAGALAGRRGLGGRRRDRDEE